MPPRFVRRNGKPRWHAQSIELGAVIGAWFIAKDHELYDGRAGWAPLPVAAPQLALRVDYYALRWIGFDIDAGVMPSKAEGLRANLWAVRGGLIARMPWRVAPFVTTGIGALGVSSARSALGDDIEASFHVGGGVQWLVTHHLALRLDLRDNIAHRRGSGGTPTHNPELGITIAFVAFERKPKARPIAAPADRDGDKVADQYDRCPSQAGAPPFGCPAGAADGDGDGFGDAEDACPSDFGGVPDGCPPSSDLDGDGLVEPEDRCPKVRGTANDGCPADVPPAPTSNAVPPEVAAFEGVLAEVTFASGTAKLMASGQATLSAVADALARHPNVEIELVGHTDTRGSEEVNRALSAERAEAVRRALVERGIAAERVSTRGAGGDEPLASNATPEGRAINRRVELRVVAPTQR